MEGACRNPPPPPALAWCGCKTAWHGKGLSVFSVTNVEENPSRSFKILIPRGTKCELTKPITGLGSKRNMILTQQTKQDSKRCSFVDSGRVVVIRKTIWTIGLNTPEPFQNRYAGYSIYRSKLEGRLALAIN